MATISLKAGEAKTIRFTVTDEDGDAVPLTGATLTFTVKLRKSDTAAVLTKADGAFDKTQQASGIVAVDVSATDTDLAAATYTGELKIVFSASNIDKSADIDFVIERAVA